MKSPIQKERAQKATNKMYLIVGSVFYVLFCIYCFHYNALKHAVDKRTKKADIFNQAFSDMLLHPLNMKIDGDILLFCFICLAVALFVLWTGHEKKLARKHDDPDTVTGTAKLMDTKDLKEYNRRFSSPLKDEERNDGFNNMILSQDIRLAIDNRGTRRNCNILVIGGSGAGKSRFFAGPNIMQNNCNYVITDPAGELLADYGKQLEDNGYKVSVFNLVDVYKSSRYNPFMYIHTEKDVFVLVETFIANTTSPNNKGGDQFWESSEKLLLNALILYIWHIYPPEKQTFSEVLNLLKEAEINENDSSAESPLDKRFMELKKIDPENLACKQYDTFKLGGAKTLKSILISVGVRMKAFGLSDIGYLTGKDTIDIEHFPDSPQAIFVIIPTTDKTFNFLVALFYTQIFATIYNYGETRVRFGYKLKTNDYVTLKTIQATNDAESAIAKQRMEAINKEIHAGHLKKIKNEDRQTIEIYTEAFLKHVATYDNKQDFDKLKEFKKLFDSDEIAGRKAIREYFTDSKAADECIATIKNIGRGGIKKSVVDGKIMVYSRELIGWRGNSKKLVNKFLEELKNSKVEKCRNIAAPNHVRFILDEFANIGQIPEFNEKLSTMRKYEISCSIILQALSQLKDLYKDNANTIVANCDTSLFLGSADTETIEWLVKRTGKKTTTVESTSWQNNNQGSTSYNKNSIELLTPDQIAKMADDECLVIVRGNNPYYGKKYDIEQHPNYKYAMATQNHFVIDADKVDNANHGPVRLWQNVDVSAVEEAGQSLNDENKKAVSSSKPKGGKLAELLSSLGDNKSGGNGKSTSSKNPKLEDPIKLTEVTADLAMQMLQSYGLEEGDNKMPGSIKEQVESTFDEIFNIDINNLRVQKTA